MTDPLGQSQVLSYMEKLAAVYDVSIISCEKRNRYAQLSNEIQERCSRAGITWHPLFFTKKPPVVSTAYDVRKMLRKADSLFKKSHYTVVHCRSYLASLVGLSMKRKYGARFIFDMRGFWIDEKIEGGYWKKDNWLFKPVIKYLRAKEKAFYQEADVVVSLTNAAKDVIVTNGWAVAEKIHVIPTCVNLEVFKPFRDPVRKKVREELGIPADAFVLLYSGGYGANYDIDFLKIIFKEIHAIYPICCILVLSKDGVTGLENDPVSKHVYSISLPYSKVSEYLMAGDLGVINYVHRFSVAGRSPTKLGEYWASGLPAVSPQGIGDVDYLFSVYKYAGILYSRADFSQRLQEVLKTDKALLREYADEYFGLDNGVKKYDNIYKLLSGTNG